MSVDVTDGTVTYNLYYEVEQPIRPGAGDVDADPGVVYEDDLTSARIVKDGDREEEATEQDLYSSGSDSDDDETNDNVAFDFSFAKERSALRNRAAAKLAETDPRYRGKKASRKQLEKERGNLSATSGNVDEIEAAQAEWGDMFEVGDDEEIDEDDEEGLDFEGEAPKKSAKGQKGKKTVMDESEDEERLLSRIRNFCAHSSSW